MKKKEFFKKKKKALFSNQATKFLKMYQVALTSL